MFEGTLKGVVIFWGIISFSTFVRGQDQPNGFQWIRPDNEKSPPIWGINNGIVVGLWPASVEGTVPGSDGGPRGLLRIGYNYRGVTYLINFIAIEPVVNGDTEFSEVRPSRTDGKWVSYSGRRMTVPQDLNLMHQPGE